MLAGLMPVARRLLDPLAPDHLAADAELAGYPTKLAALSIWHKPFPNLSLLEQSNQIIL
jgi:hypothetical protein